MKFMQLNNQFLLEGGDAAPDSHLQRIMNGLHLHSDSWECQGNIHLHDIEANHQSWNHNQAILMAARAARSIAQSSSCWWVSLNPQVRNSTLKPGSLCSCKVVATQRGRSTVMDAGPMPRSRTNSMGRDSAARVTELPSSFAISSTTTSH